MKNKNAFALLATLFLCLIHGETKADQPTGATSATSSIDTELRLARERILKDRPYNNSSYTGFGKIRLDIKPYQQVLEEAPDWWSEKQAYDLSILLARALDYYPDIEVSHTQTWEAELLNKEIEGKNTDAIPGTSTVKPAPTRGTVPKKIRLSEIIQEAYEIKPSITGYSFKYLRPKKQGIGLGFIAITNKSCTAESWLESAYEISPLNAQDQQKATINSLGQSGISSSVQISELIQKTTGGTSLNINFLFGGAGGGDFEPPEKATKEIIYDTIIDASEKIHCTLVNNSQCIEYYAKRAQVKPTVEKKIREKRGLFGRKIDDKKRGC